jgi:hypothetical protein
MVVQSRRYCLGYFWVGSCLSTIFEEISQKMNRVPLPWSRRISRFFPRELSDWRIKNCVNLEN